MALWAYPDQVGFQGAKIPKILPYSATNFDASRSPPHHTLPDAPSWGCTYTLELYIDPGLPQVPALPGFPSAPCHISVTSEAYVLGRVIRFSADPASRSNSGFRGCQVRTHCWGARFAVAQSCRPRRGRGGLSRRRNCTSSARCSAASPITGTALHRANSGWRPLLGASAPCACVSGLAAPRVMLWGGSPA